MIKYHSSLCLFCDKQCGGLALITRFFSFNFLHLALNILNLIGYNCRLVLMNCFLIKKSLLSHFQPNVFTKHQIARYPNKNYQISRVVQWPQSGCKLILYKLHFSTELLASVITAEPFNLFGEMVCSIDPQFG